MSFDPFTILAVFVSYVLAMTLHEFAHGWVAHQLGDTTAQREGRLTLNPLAHIDPINTLLVPIVTFLVAGIAIGAARPVPFNPWALRGGRWGAALVAASGPFTNLLIAMVLGTWLRFVPLGVAGYNFIGIMILINVGLFVFNMLPLPPLDGSRVLYAAAPPGLREIMDRIEQAGMMVIFVLILGMYYFGLGAYLYRVVQWIISLIVPIGSLP